ncbi:Sec-independent protein translocase TatB [Arthrobacter sp. 92]|uniref:Sec-independent protein translocase TatB n=1 Tax=Arthrobacter sp. 92 TaxID=3418175 RepID=UPI003CFBF248
MFGIDAEKLFVLLLLGSLVLGPDKLPGCAAKLARIVMEVRRLAAGAQDRLRDELGPDFEDVNWDRLDPRQYDPRRIIREAFTDLPRAEYTEPDTLRPVTPAGGTAPQGVDRVLAVGPVPFDSEAT